MTWTIAIAIWCCLTAGVYLMLSRDVLRSVVGLAVLGSGANLALFAAGRLGPEAPPVVPLGETVLREAANPLPQALVLTAIVIGLSLVCFSLVLVLRLVERAGTDDALALRHAEPIPTDAVKPPLSAPPGDEPSEPHGGRRP